MNRQPSHNINGEAKLNSADDSLLLCEVWHLNHLPQLVRNTECFEISLFL